jgi:hypothetical protein
MPKVFNHYGMFWHDKKESTTTFENFRSTTNALSWDEFGFLHLNFFLTIQSRFSFWLFSFFDECVSLRLSIFWILFWLCFPLSHFWAFGKKFKIFRLYELKHSLEVNLYQASFLIPKLKKNFCESQWKTKLRKILK